VNVALQDDFSMNQTLSLYVHDRSRSWIRTRPTTRSVLLTLRVILDDPDIILRRQLDR